MIRMKAYKAVRKPWFPGMLMMYSRIGVDKPYYIRVVLYSSSYVVVTSLQLQAHHGAKKKATGVGEKMSCCAVGCQKFQTRCHSFHLFSNSSNDKARILSRLAIAS